MKTVYLIRHALPDFPGGKGMCIGTTDIPLGTEGLAQAAEMAARLPPVTGVYSSPLIRSIQTAQAITADVTVLEGLREMYAGDWDGLTFEEIKVRYKELYDARGIDPTLPLPNAEDREEGCARFHAAMLQAARESEGDIAVVAHGGIIAQFLKVHCGVHLKPDYVQILPLTYANGTFSL